MVVGEKYAIVSSPATGLGKCDNMLLTEPCYINPVQTCTASPELWTSDGENCTAIIDGQSRVLETGSGYCGVGTSRKTLKESNLTDAILAGKSIGEYKRSVNWDACQQTQASSCNVICQGDDVASECPNLTDMTWISAGEGTCYKRDHAIAVVEGRMNFENARAEEPIDREEAINSRALGVDGNVDGSLLRKGLKIYFLAGSNYSADELRNKGCSIYYTKECEPERTSADCDYTEDPGICTEQTCASRKERTITRTVTLPAWGNNGRCDVIGMEPTDRGCDVAPSCCDESYVGAWQAVIGEDGCVSNPSTNNIIKRKYTREGNGNKCSESNVKYEYDPSCVACGYSESTTCDTTTTSSPIQKSTTTYSPITADYCYTPTESKAASVNDTDTTCLPSCITPTWTMTPGSCSSTVGIRNRTVTPSNSPSGGRSLCTNETAPSTTFSDSTCVACDYNTTKSSICRYNANNKGQRYHEYTWDPLSSACLFTGKPKNGYVLDATCDNCPTTKTYGECKSGAKRRRHYSYRYETTGDNEGCKQEGAPSPGDDSDSTCPDYTSQAVAGQSDPRLKNHISKIGVYGGMNVYEWIWNDIATRIYGLKGREIGFLTTELDAKYVGRDEYGYDYIRGGTIVADAVRFVRETMVSSQPKSPQEPRGGIGF